MEKYWIIFCKFLKNDSNAQTIAKYYNLSQLWNLSTLISMVDSFIIKYRKQKTMK